MKTAATTWLAQIVVVLVMLAAGSASASSGLLGENSCRGENSLEGGFRWASSSVSGELCQSWGDSCQGSAADSAVAPTRGANPHIEGLTPQAGARGTGVARATRLEVELVQQTGKGTVEWTAEEIAFIKENGRLPPGTVGHHINNVAEFPEWAGDPRNIKFVRGQAGNLAEHGGNFQNPTTGPLIDRQILIDKARGVP
jgi:GHH signature containing HNH/Endo VII superfamily nuclease toxin